MSQAGAVAGFDDQNQCWVETGATLARSNQNELKKLGVQFPRHRRHDQDRGVVLGGDPAAGARTRAGRASGRNARPVRPGQRRGTLARWSSRCCAWATTARASAGWRTPARRKGRTGRCSAWSGRPTTRCCAPWTASAGAGPRGLSGTLAARLGGTGLFASAYRSDQAAAGQDPHDPSAPAVGADGRCALPRRLRDHGVPPARLAASTGRTPSSKRRSR